MKIKLNATTIIDLDKLVESRMLVQANSGGGKSWAIRRIIEQSFGHVQIIVIDPEGEFGNMRAEFDFAYVGKDGDTPAQSRSAAILATRLLELKSSAVIDLYELPPQERKHFVRLFCEAMVNAPKELWHDVLLIIDEAHVFAPEKGESEALGAVIDLATRGRKRGFCVILATQRLSKLNKDAAAECNNKLIGRASQDIDRKRSGEELGFTKREEIISLRNLRPGEFYAFGPAISQDVEKVTIGDVKVKPQKRGVVKQAIPAPSAAVKKILSKLADLPQEAEQEARTVAELKSQILVLQRAAKAVKPEGKWEYDKVTSQVREYINGVLEGQMKEQDQRFKKFKDALYQKLLKSHGNVFRALESLSKDIDTIGPSMTQSNLEPAEKFYTKSPAHYALMNREEVGSDHAQFKKVIKSDGIKIISDDTHDISKLEPYRPTPKEKETLTRIREDYTEMKLAQGERQVLIAIAQQPDGMTREHITVQTGYKRSTRDAYIQRLQLKGYIVIMKGHSMGQIIASDDGIKALGNNYEPLPTGRELLEYHLRKLPEGEAKILRLLADSDFAFERERISNETGFKRSTRDAYIQRLATRQLIVVEGQTIRISEHLHE